ncbi:MAG: energy-coupling factor ABC transporter permease [Gammaproteobacteria bacterium]|nr:energy-coupling factor ABC transporter permease [Gammaproteobacteria bacterium]MBL6998696.1 energy-coupling factor ABC transporter permease [Gammaproteobacteria bacterium]
MDLNSIHLDPLWLWAHWLYWPVLLWAIVRAPWSILIQKDSSNILFASCAAVFLFWQLKIHLADGLSIHLLGATILTLMFRWQVAIMANSAIILGVTLISSADFAGFAMNALLTGVLPVAISYLLWWINERFLPANYFVYIFFAGFFAAALSILITGFISYELLSLLENQLSEEILDQYLMIYIPIMYPEAFITGAVISIFVIYKPQWISTFDDRRYLHKRS